MLILINIDVVVSVLDSMYVHNFYYLMVDRAKMSLFVELIIGPTQGLDDTTIIAEAKYSINFTESRIDVR